MNTNKMFNGYWMSYQPSGIFPSETLGEDNKVTLFVANPTRDGAIQINYLYKEYTKQKQIRWAKQLQNQGTEVLMCLTDSPSAPWNDVNIPAFVRNFKRDIIDGDWGLNGVDIDLESGMNGDVSASTFIRLIREFRAVLGPIDTTNSNGRYVSRISVAAYWPTLDQSILENAGNELDWQNTMAYGNGLNSSCYVH